jgi:hypothetical protein
MAIIKSYFVGRVIGTGDNVGGLAGGIKGNIGNSYSISEVTTGKNETRRLVGIDQGSINNSYYNNFWNPSLNISGMNHGKTKTEMRQKSTFIGWDFSNIWNISGTMNNGYPYLR